MYPFTFTKQYCINAMLQSANDMRWPIMARCMHCSKIKVQCCEQQDALYEQALQQRTLRALMPTHDASALTMCLLMALAWLSLFFAYTSTLHLSGLSGIPGTMHMLI